MALYKGNQKVCPIIKVDNASSGYKFTMNLTGDSARVSWTINDSITSSTGNNFSLNDGFTLTYPNVQTIRFSGDIGSSYTTGTVYIGGTAHELKPNVTYTLQSNSDYADIDFATCLTGDTLITMADGKTIRIDSLKVGDKILSLNPETNELEEDEIISCDADLNKEAEEYDIWTFENNIIIKTINRHRFYNIDREDFVYLNEWNLGERAYTQDGNSVKLINHENIKEKVNHYTLFTKKWNNYFANGLLSGNRNSQKLNGGNK